MKAKTDTNLNTLNSLRESLKTETSESHRAVERAMESQSCLSSPQGFAKYLRAMLCCHARYGHAETVVAGCAGIDLQNDLLIEALQADLRRIACGETIEATRSDAFRVPNPTKDVSWGIQYALEGSSIGARQLLPLSSQFFSDGEPSRYLSRLCQHGSSRWRSFIAALEFNKPEKTSAVLGARLVFDTARQTLEI